MKIPLPLFNGFGAPFEACLAEFLNESNYLADPSCLQSERFLRRSITPHILRLSRLFNRHFQESSKGLDPYWKQSSHPQHLRLAYFLYFMPSHLFRVASVWSELKRLGFQWQTSDLQAIEWGAGPASGACGAAAGEHFASMGASRIHWSLVEQDRAILTLGKKWSEHYFQYLNLPWETQAFQQKIDLKRPLLPKHARFHLWLMSFCLNELNLSPQELAPLLVKHWEKHLHEEGLIILVEPALKAQSRKLLELRQAILAQKTSLQVLLPCLGSRCCGALSHPEDWCHEQVSWWRPSLIRTLDSLAHLDHKTLSFSYLILAKSNRPLEALLPRLQGNNLSRLVSPVHLEGKKLEFFLCHPTGKHRVRLQSELHLERGDILLDPNLKLPGILKDPGTLV